MFDQTNMRGGAHDVSGMDNLISDLLKEDHHLTMDHSPTRGNNILLQNYHILTFKSTYRPLKPQ